MNISPSLISLFTGFGLAGIVSLLAWGAGVLTPSGAGCAFGVGGLIFALGGWPWATLLLTFFISSSGLSKLFRKRKAMLSEKYAKGSRRDWGQVLANGGLGAFLVLVQAYHPDQLWPWLAYAGAMATVNGDTWATELGVLSRTPPRLITTGELIEHGDSGGVTITGSFATLSGAALLALVMILFGGPTASPSGAAAVILGGLAGAFFDSLLGATVQAIYYDPKCAKYTEHRVPDVSPERGWAWMNNDAVNLISSMFGALTTVMLWILFVGL